MGKIHLQRQPAAEHHGSSAEYHVRLMKCAAWKAIGTRSHWR
jgi:hypothetical protein